MADSAERAADRRAARASVRPNPARRVAGQRGVTKIPDEFPDAESALNWVRLVVSHFQVRVVYGDMIRGTAIPSRPEHVGYVYSEASKGRLVLQRGVDGLHHIDLSNVVGVLLESRRWLYQHPRFDAGRFAVRKTRQARYTISHNAIDIGTLTLKEANAWIAFYNFRRWLP